LSLDVLRRCGYFRFFSLWPRRKGKINAAVVKDDGAEAHSSPQANGTAGA
jgi:hypothetical protein